MPNLFVKKTFLGGGVALVPAYESDLEVLKALKESDIVEVKFVKKRNVKLHRKFFALIKLLFDNQDHYKRIGDLREDLTVASGYYTERVNKFTGELKIEAKSISFAKMDDVEFNQLYKDFLTTACRLIKCSTEEFEKNLIAYM